MISKRIFIDKGYGMLLLSVILKIALGYLIINPVYELHRDEYLYLDQGNHLAAGYLSVPPFISWVAWLIEVLGGTIFWVKFFPALFGAISIMLVWFLIEELHGNIYAKVLASTALIFSALLRIDLLFQPNSFDILSWTASYFFLIKFFITRRNTYLYWMAVVIAIGFLNKYIILFLVLGLIPALLVNKKWNIFLNKHLYLAALLALLLVLPNLIWQYEHGFPVIVHMKTLTANQLVNVSRTDFLFTQLFFFYTSFFVLMAAFASFFLFKPFRLFRFIGWSYLFSMLIFLFFRAKAYYALGLYPVLMAFGCVYLEKLLSNSWQWYLRPVLPLIIIGAFVPLVPYVFPLLTPAKLQEKADMLADFGLTRWEDGKLHSLPQDFADMQGWKELANKVKMTYDQLPKHKKEHTMIICGNYGQAGAINFYNKGKILQAVSFEADYVFWMPLKNEVRTILLIDDEPDSVAKALFNKISLQARIENKMAREYGTAIYMLEEPNYVIRNRLQAMVQERKNKYRYR